MKRYPVNNEIDFLVARAQAETDVAKNVLAGARESGDYWQEKVAVKLAEFYEREEKMLALYAEIKTHYPKLAETLESKKPYLVDLLNNARNAWKSQGERN